MAIYSHPWTSIGGDRAVSDAMDMAYFAAAHGNLVLTGLEPTLSGANVSVSPGTAVIQGRVVTVDAAVTLTPTINRRARIVLRLDIANRTAEVALSGTTTSYPSLTRSGAVWELGLGTVDTTAATTVTDTRADFTLCGIYDTGWQTTLVTGWSTNHRRVGNTVFLNATRTSLVSDGATVTSPAVVPSSFTPTGLTTCAVRGSGGLVGVANISNAGIITLTNQSGSSMSTCAVSATYHAT